MIRGSRHVDDLCIPMKLNVPILFWQCLQTLKLTNRTWKWLVGRQIFAFCGPAYSGLDDETQRVEAPESLVFWLVWNLIIPCLLYIMSKCNTYSLWLMIYLYCAYLCLWPIPILFHFFLFSLELELNGRTCYCEGCKWWEAQSNHPTISTNLVVAFCCPCSPLSCNIMTVLYPIFLYFYSFSRRVPQTIRSTFWSLQDLLLSFGKLRASGTSIILTREIRFQFLA